MSNAHVQARERGLPALHSRSGRVRRRRGGVPAGYSGDIHQRADRDSSCRSLQPVQRLPEAPTVDRSRICPAQKPPSAQVIIPARSPCGSTRSRRWTMSTACPGRRTSPATGCQTMTAESARPYTAQRRRDLRSRARNSRGWRERPPREKCVPARLLRPLDVERARGEKQPAHHGNPPIDELTSQDDEECARDHCRKHGGQSKGPLGCPRDQRLRLPRPSSRASGTLDVFRHRAVNPPSRV